MAEQVTILGDGAMGTVCALLLQESGHAVTMWGAFAGPIAALRETRENPKLLPGVKLPPTVQLTSDDAQCFAGATMILSAIPTQYLRSMWGRLKPHVPAGVPIISVTKGIENQTLLRPTQVVAEAAGGGRPLAALSGPNIAGELARRLPAMAVVAGEDEQFSRRVQSAFSTPWFRVYTNCDVIGVELAGATKNVIAIAAGILDGLNAGNNVKAALVSRGLVEIARLGVAMGAEAATFQGLAGLGDLITTCVSPEGRNRRVGEQLGKGHRLADVLATMDSVAEGVPTTRSVLQLAQRHQVEMPITQAVHDILFGNKSVTAALHELMSRDRKAEGAG